MTKSKIYIPLPSTLEQARQKLALELLEYCSGNKSQAANLMQVSIKTFRKIVNTHVSGQDYKQ